MSGRSLALGRTGNIGFLTHYRHSLSPSSFYGEILTGVDREAQRHGYYVIFSADGSGRLPTMVQEQRVDGLILAGCDIPRELIVSVKLQGFPLVLVDNHHDHVNSVVIDNVGGAYEAVTHLINLGHRRIAFICEWLGDLSFSERFEGYRKALQDHRIPLDEDLIAEGAARQPNSGYIAMQRVLERATPTAVFAANDPTAFEAIRALREHGLRIPQDVAIVGFDDNRFVPMHTDPPLTTMHVYREKMGAIAAQRLLELIEEPDQPPTHTKVFTRLIVRGSCGAAPSDSYAEGGSHAVLPEPEA